MLQEAPAGSPLLRVVHPWGELGAGADGGSRVSAGQWPTQWRGSAGQWPTQWRVSAGQWPTQWGARFSRKAVMPSWASAASAFSVMTALVCS